MAYWLVKSEPFKWSWQQQVAKGIERWDGVRNHQAANNLKAMRLGEQAFFYHSNEGKEIVGIVEVAREAYPDPTDDKGRFVAVDMKAVKALPVPVGLDKVKTMPNLKAMALVRSARLSVQPVTEAEWAIILKEGGLG
jgi:predicted RNA-binding protein with PUA-like domain